MFELGFSEILLTAVVALVVLGPQRLPQVARTAGYWLGRLQRFVAGVKSDLAGQAGMDDFHRAKDEVLSAARGLRQELADTGTVWDDLPPWERLPEQRTPADFGIMADAEAAQAASHVLPVLPRHQVSLRRQAMLRKRDRRPRFHPRPQLRVRRHSSSE